MISYQNPANNASDADSLHSNFERLLRGKAFIEIVRVEAIDGDTVDIIPLVTQMDLSGAPIENSVIYGASIFRLKRGSSAVIMNPVPGDIGLALFMDKDSDNARSSKEAGAPNTTRTHSKTDAVYLGGILYDEPTQFVEFADDAIIVKSPLAVIIDSPITHITENVTIGGNLRVAGDITDNYESQSSSIRTLRVSYNGHKHSVSGVESGGSTVVSETTDSEA